MHLIKNFLWRKTTPCQINFSTRVWKIERSFKKLYHCGFDQAICFIIVYNKAKTTFIIFQQMFCSLVSFDFLFPRDYCWSKVSYFKVKSLKKSKKYGLNFSLKIRFLPQCAFETYFEFEEMLHIYLKFHGCNDAWMVGSYMYYELCVFFTSKVQKSAEQNLN